MIKFLKWWYTNSEGREYMTFTGCSQEDYIVVIITAILSAIIVIVYFMISYVAKKHSKNYPNSITKKYLNEIHKVFAFCALTGYGYLILSVFINPYKLRIVLLLILIIYSIRLLKSIKKSKVIDRIFQGEELIKEKLESYRKLAIRFSTEEEDGLITIKELSEVPYNIWSEWVNGVRYKREKHPQKNVYFITEMDPLKTKEGIALFGTQWHDCIEILTVLKGHLMELKQEGKIYKEGETFTYKPMEKHKPGAKVFSKYGVEFK